MPETFDSSRRKKNEQNNGSVSSLSTLATMSVWSIMLESGNTYGVAKWQEFLDNQTIPRQSTLGGNHGMNFLLT
jgi:hypothetical protein